jgi:hypothetical protein
VVSVSGFKSEKALWKWMKPHMRGKWRRCEMIHPAGPFDLMGVCGEQFSWVELKVGFPSFKALEASQHDFIDFARPAKGVGLYLAFGGLNSKDVLFFSARTGAALKGTHFWRGPVVDVAGYLAPIK